MKKKLLPLSIVLTSLFLFVGSYILTNQVKFGICDLPYTSGEYTGCFDESSIFGELLGFVAILFFVLSPFMFFIEEKIVKKWIYVSSIFLPVAMYIVLISAGRSAGFSILPSAEQILVVLFGGIYVIFSVILVVYGVYRHKKNKIKYGH